MRTGCKVENDDGASGVSPLLGVTFIASALVYGS